MHDRTDAHSVCRTGYSLSEGRIWEIKNADLHGRVFGVCKYCVEGRSVYEGPLVQNRGVILGTGHMGSVGQ